MPNTEKKRKLNSYLDEEQQKKIKVNPRNALDEEKIKEFIGRWQSGPIEFDENLAKQVSECLLMDILNEKSNLYSIVESSRCFEK